MGWVIAAALVNLAVMVRWMNVDLSPMATAIFGSVLVILAAAIGLIARLTIHNYFFPLAVAWALTAIAVKQSGQTAVVVAAALGVIACLIATLSFVVNLKGTSDE